MDLGPPVGVRGQVGGEFLHPVLPAYGDAGSDGGPDGVVALHLGGGAQRDLPRVAACCPGGRGDPGLNGLHMTGNLHGIHMKPFSLSRRRSPGGYLRNGRASGPGC